MDFSDNEPNILLMIQIIDDENQIIKVKALDSVRIRRQWGIILNIFLVSNTQYIFEH